MRNRRYYRRLLRREARFYADVTVALGADRSVFGIRGNKRIRTKRMARLFKFARLDILAERLKEAP